MLLGTETVQQRQLPGMWLRSRQTKVAIDCWHIIDTIWRELSGKYKAAMSQCYAWLSCLDLSRWSSDTIYGFLSLIRYSSQTESFSAQANSPCMTLVFSSYIKLGSTWVTQNKWVSLFSGIEHWNGMVEWNGIVEWPRPPCVFCDNLHHCICTLVFSNHG